MASEPSISSMSGLQTASVVAIHLEDEVRADGGAGLAGDTAGAAARDSGSRGVLVAGSVITSTRGGQASMHSSQPLHASVSMTRVPRVTTVLRCRLGCLRRLGLGSCGPSCRWRARRVEDPVPRDGLGAGPQRPGVAGNVLGAVARERVGQRVHQVVDRQDPGDGGVGARAPPSSRRPGLRARWRARSPGSVTRATPDGTG